MIEEAAPVDDVVVVAAVVDMDELVLLDEGLVEVEALLVPEPVDDDDDELV